MNNSDTQFHLIALSMVPTIGPVLARQLIAYSGGVEAVFRQSNRALSRIPGIGPERASAIKKADIKHLAEKECQFIAKHEIRVMSFLDTSYPSRLKVFDSMPIVLYYKGNASLNSKFHVGIVGTRTSTHYGKSNCEQIVKDLNPIQPLVLSGLAYGIDITAHRSAMKNGLATVGVMGTGLDMIYPAAHRKDAEMMLESGGLLTEFTSGFRMDQERFPMRNRIIAAMSDALVVVESKEAGGSIITANLAFDYNKDVFALPGRVNDPKSMGTNLLIKEQKAALIRSGSDIIEAMLWDQEVNKLGTQRVLFEDLDTDEQRIVATLKAENEIHIDLIQIRSGFSPSKLAGTLLNLEFKGLIRSLPGKRYYLIK
jgi:DNA processing protein